MINSIFRYISLFVILVLLQVLILNNIEFSGYINPYMYILFLLLLPFETPSWLLLFIGFFLGISVDVFSDTLGMHASASVFAGFIRPYVLKILSPREGYEAGTLPKVKDYGMSWFARYSIFMIVPHHFFLFYMEAFSLSDFFITFFRVFVSSIFTIGFILGVQFFFSKKK